MAAILLDVDGVLHVSGEPVRGAARAIDHLRADGHRLRFVTNSTTRSRADLAGELRGLGIPVAEDELQTTPRVAARVLAGRRVFALVMDGIVGELEDVELVGEEADAVLLGGADETPETGRVFSYTNLARAFAELELGAELFCLHRNRWWQTSRGPLLDAGAFVAGLEYAAGVQATVLGKPSAAYYAAALEAVEADASQAWMVGDDLESDVAGAHAAGLRTVLVRTGKFREEDLEHARTQPDVVISSLADLPGWLEGL